MKLYPLSDPFNCRGGKCPTIYKNEKGNYVIQGFKIEEVVDVEIPKNEYMVELPKEFLDDFIKNYWNKLK